MNWVNNDKHNEVVSILQIGNAKIEIGYYWDNESELGVEGDLDFLFEFDKKFKKLDVAQKYVEKKLKEFYKNLGKEF